MKCDSERKLKMHTRRWKEQERKKSKCGNGLKHTNGTVSARIMRKKEGTASECT